jgi:hypothetical protein
MLVLAAALLFVAFVMVAPCACETRPHQACIDARTIQSVAAFWRDQHGANRCPTMERLVADGELSASSKLDDPWGHRYLIRCDADEVLAISSGPDGRVDTADDIVAGP